MAERRPSFAVYRLDRRKMLGLLAVIVLSVAGKYVLFPDQPGRQPKAVGETLPQSQALDFLRFFEVFRVVHVEPGIPPFDPDTWRLTVEGLVGNPRTFTYDELLALPRVQVVASFYCVAGWGETGLRWEGVALKTLMNLVGAKPEGEYVEFYSADRQVGYMDNFWSEYPPSLDVLLAHHLNDKPLPLEHGGPLRLVVPSMYGYKNVKWVNRIVVTNKLVLGYWEERGYPFEAWITQ